MLRPAIALLLLLPAGCTHEVLARNTARSAGTVMDIEYQMVLNNVARFVCNAGMLPSHVRLQEGTVQVSDEAGINGLGVTWEGDLGFSRGPMASRQLAEQWGTNAVTDALDLKALQDVYRLLLGLPPNPDPEYLHKARESEADSGGSEQESGDGPPSVITAPLESITSFSGEEPNDSQDGFAPWPSEQSPDGQTIQRYPDVPQGWFHVGSEDDVPEDACYVGSYRDVYVWVPPEGMDDFSKFTLLVLSIITTDIERTGGGGLMFTH